MVDQQIVVRGIRHPALIAAMRTVPREAFVGADQLERAFEDSPLPIDAGQTISQPYVVAVMIEAVAVQAQDRVLEVGAGSGYAAALMARIAAAVAMPNWWKRRASGFRCLASPTSNSSRPMVRPGGPRRRHSMPSSSRRAERQSPRLFAGILRLAGG